MASLEMALDLARRGFRIFPLGDDCKPEFTGWPEKATTDETQIRAWWTDPVMEWQLDRNVGIACGQGLQVIDLDEKDGRQGIANFNTVEDIKGEPVPPTFTVRTPSGGLHRYVQVDGAYGNTAGRIAKGIDTRGDSGYVVGPGSEKAAGVYEIIDPAPVAAAPGWLLGYLAPYSPPTDHSTAIADLDTPYAVMRAIEMLREAPAVTEAGVGNNRTFAMAAKVKDFGISRDTTVMLLEQYWNSRSDFARSPEELRYVVGNAYRHGRNAPGALDPAQEFKPVEEQSDDPNARDTILEWGDSEDFSDEPDPLCDGILFRKEVMLVPGAPNAGKTAVMTRFVVCGAKAEPFGNHATCGFGSLVLFGEGKPGAKKRKAAMKRVIGAEDLPIRLVLTDLNLLRKGVARVIGHCDRYRKKYGQYPDVVVLDTLASLAAGYEENDTAQATLMVERFEAIVQAIGCSLVVLTHYGKDESRGVRGSTVLFGACSAVLNVDGKKKTLWMSKNREDELPPPMGYSLAKMEVGRYPSGKPIAGVVAHLTGRPVKTGKMIEDGLRQEQLDLLNLVRSLAAGGQAGNLTTKEIAQQAVAGDVVESCADPVETVRKRLKRLRDVGLLQELDGYWRPAETF